MGKPKTIEERVGILEKGEEDCQKLYESRHKEYMKRIERLENKLIGVLGFGVVILLAVIADIAIALIKK